MGIPLVDLQAQQRSLEGATMKDDKKKTEAAKVEKVDETEEKIPDEDLEDATGGTFSVLGGERMWKPGMSTWKCG